MDPLAPFWVHATTIERYTGSGPEGDDYDAPVVDVLAFVEMGPKLVRNDTGEEVVSMARVFYPAGTAYVPPRSYVTPPAAFGGIRARVISCAVHDAGALPLPAHVEVILE